MTSERNANELLSSDLNEYIFEGLVGELIEIYEPHSEASTLAMAAQFLVAFGSAVGHNPYVATSAERHHTNEFLLLVGDTGNSRKGTSLNPVLDVMDRADPEWAKNRGGGLSSAEGLIESVKDEVISMDEDGNETVEVEGVLDKRLLVTETEFASVLIQFTRLGNNLSATVRQAWDGGRLLVRTRGNPLRATNPHVSIIGHTTEQDLHRHLSSTEAANGFANRFLVVPARRNGVKPFPGEPDPKKVQELADKVAQRIAQARFVGKIELDPTAVEMWELVYPVLSNVPNGLIGNLTARSHSHVQRLALIYCLIQNEHGNPMISNSHILSAIAVVSVCKTEVARMFSNATGDRVADMIIDGMEIGQKMTKTGLRDSGIVSKRLRPGESLGASLNLLSEMGKIEIEVAPTDGRSVTMIKRIR